VVFDEYCDWYLELLKAGEASPEMAGAALEQLLALAHPLMPFVTEEGWSRLPGATGLMAVHTAPRTPGPRDEAAEAEMAAVQEAVTALRGYRSRRGLPPRAPLLMDPAPHLAVVALDWVEAAPEGEREGLVPTLLGDGRSIGVGPAREAVDPEVERARLADELAAAESELARAEAKLGNAAFVERAPAHLVDAEREKVERYGAERDSLAARLAALQ
jgi:valyl-tRNA synthetase